MKKLMCSLVAVLALGATTTMKAQEQGKFTLGANLSTLTESSFYGVGAKLRYGLTNDIRLEGAVSYYLPKSKVSALDFSVNAHYVVGLDDKISVYPVVGIGYLRTMTSIEGVSSTGNFTTNFGGGASYQLNEKLSLGAELKYQFIKSANTPVIGVNAMFAL